MGDPNLWGRGGPDSKAIRQSLNQIASEAASQARSFGYSQSYGVPALGEGEAAPAKPAGLTPPRYGGNAAAPAVPAFQLPKLPEIKLELPQIQDLSKLMQQSPVPGVGGLGHALEQAAGETKEQWNPAGIRDVPILSAIPRGLETAANILGPFEKEFEPLRGYPSAALSERNRGLTALPTETLGTVSAVREAYARGDEQAATRESLAGVEKVVRGGVGFYRAATGGPLPVVLNMADFAKGVVERGQARGSAGQPLNENLGQQLKEWRDEGQTRYDQSDGLSKLITDIAVDPLTWIPGAGVGKAQKGKLVAEAMTPIEGGLRTGEQLVHANTGLGRFPPWDKTSRLHETVKTGMQAIADTTLNAPDFATALNNISRWGGAGTEGGFNALKAYLGKPNLTLYEQRAARFLAGFPERTRNIEKVYNTLGRDLTSLHAVDPKKVPAGPLRMAVENIRAKGIDDAAEIGRLLDDAARDHLAADAMQYMADEGQKVLKIPPPNLGQRFLDNVLRPLEAIAYIGTNPFSLMTNWANNKATLVLEGVSPWMKMEARIARLEAAGVTGVAAELRKAERAYQALAQTELAVAKATGRGATSGTGLMGQMGGAIGKLGREKTLLGVYAKLEQADRKIANLHGVEQGLRNWKVATKGGGGWVPELPAGVLAHLTPDDAKRIYATIRDAGPNPKALREMVGAILDGHGASLDYEQMARGLSERLTQTMGQPIELGEDAARAILASGGHAQALEEAAANIARRVRAGEAFDLVRDDELGKVAQKMLERFKTPTAEELAFTKQVGKYDFSVLSDKALEREWNNLIQRGQKGLKLTPAQDARMQALRSERARRGLGGVSPAAGPAPSSRGPATPPGGAPSTRGLTTPKPKGFPSQNKVPFGIRREEYQLTAQGLDPMQVAEIMNNPRLRRWWRSRNDMVDTLKARNVPKQELDATITKWEKRNPMPKGMTPEPQMPIEPPEKAAPPVAPRVEIEDLRKLAIQKGVPTATEKGAPVDQHLVNVLNKHKAEGAEAFTKDNVAQRLDEAKQILEGYTPSTVGGAIEPRVVSFDQFAAEKGADRIVMGEDLSRLPGATKTTYKQAGKEMERRIAKNEELLASARKEYDQFLAEGKIRPPTTAEHLQGTAKGMPELPSTQAAQRVMEKRTAAAAAKPVEVVAPTTAPSRVRYNSGSLGDTLKAAERLKSEEPLYVYATANGYAIDKMPPPPLQQYIRLNPDGTREVVSKSEAFMRAERATSAAEAVAPKAAPIAAKPAAQAGKGVGATLTDDEIYQAIIEKKNRLRDEYERQGGGLAASFRKTTAKQAAQRAKKPREIKGVDELADAERDFERAYMSARKGEPFPQDLRDKYTPKPTTGPGSFAAERQYEWTPAMEREQRALAAKAATPLDPAELQARIQRGELTRQQASQMMMQSKGALTDTEVKRLRQLDEIKQHFQAGEVLQPPRTPAGVDLLEESQRQLRELAINEGSARALGVTAQQQSEAQQFGEILAIVRDMWQRQAPAIAGAEKRGAVMGWLERDVIPLTNDARTAAMKLGDWMEGATVLNYNGKNFLDNTSSLYMPFGFFRFHYGQETLRRAVDRPALVSLYLHLRESLDSVQDDPAYPQRLRGKTRIALPFLPEYMGGGAFFDPLEKIAPVKQVFGLNQFQQGGVDDGDVAQSIRALAVRGEVDAAEAANAIAQKDGSELWRQTKARLQEMQGETQGLNAFSDLFQPHAPVDVAWKVLTGRPQDVGPLFPLTRLVKGATAPIVPGGINIEAPLKAGLRQLTGQPAISDYDAYEPYRVNRELANMVAEGKVSPRDALNAILEQSGPFYTQAKQRAGEVGAVSALSGVAAQVFPEGERLYYKAKVGRDRLLDAEILKAGGAPATMSADQKWDFVAEHGLDQRGTALYQYREAHPELRVKGATFDEPEGILKDLLISDLWEKYQGLDKLNKSAVAKQMPPEFKANFLDKEGRGENYANVTLEDLVEWARRFKLYVPQTPSVKATLGANAQAAPDLRFAPPEQARRYEQYRNYVATVFNMDKLQPLLNQYHALPKSAGGGLTVQQRQFRVQHPQVDQYQRMYSEFLRKNPDIAFVLNPQGQRFYATQATYGTAVTGLQKMIQQMTSPRTKGPLGR